MGIMEKNLKNLKHENGSGSISRFNPIQSIINPTGEKTFPEIMTQNKKMKCIIWYLPGFTLYIYSVRPSHGPWSGHLLRNESMYMYQRKWGTKLAIIPFQCFDEVFWLKPRAGPITALQCVPLSIQYCCVALCSVSLNCTFKLRSRMTLASAKQSASKTWDFGDWTQMAFLCMTTISSIALTIFILYTWGY